MSETINSDPVISTARIFAGFCSFLFPGLGQLLLDQIKFATLCFCLSVPVWFVASFLIALGLDDSSQLILFLGIVMALSPNVVSAYFAANGHKSKMTQITLDRNADMGPDDKQKFGFEDYASYQNWCVENGNEPMSPKQFDDTFGKN